jgi:hypothetical protein
MVEKRSMASLLLAALKERDKTKKRFCFALFLRINGD